MNNTVCSGCYFAQEINSTIPCAFNIPDIIKEYKTIDTRNNYYVIKNYSCRYGFSKKTYSENIDKFSEIDMIKYVKEQNIVKYSLALVLDKEYSYDQLIDNINQLSIKPQYITIICFDKGSQLYQLLNSGLEPYIEHKVHNFLDNISGSQALHVALETNKSKIGNLMWILNAADIKQILDNDSIQNINYIINVEQKPAHYYKSSYINSNFSGIFINTNNYWTLSKTADSTIEHNANTLVINYD